LRRGAGGTGQDTTTEIREVLGGREGPGEKGATKSKRKKKEQARREGKSRMVPVTKKTTNWAPASRTLKGGGTTKVPVPGKKLKKVIKKDIQKK